MYLSHLFSCFSSLLYIYYCLDIRIHLFLIYWSYWHSHYKRFHLNILFYLPWTHCCTTTRSKKSLFSFLKCLNHVFYHLSSDPCMNPRLIHTLHTHFFRFISINLHIFLFMNIGKFPFHLFFLPSIVPCTLICMALNYLLLLLVHQITHF